MNKDRDSELEIKTSRLSTIFYVVILNTFLLILSITIEIATNELDDQITRILISVDIVISLVVIILTTYAKLRCSSMFCYSFLIVKV